LPDAEMINTVLVEVDPDDPQPDIVELGAVVIRSGGLVAFPTETVYGLGADALNPDAIARIFEAKGRPADNPLIVHVCDREMFIAVSDGLPPNATPLIERFWPGPLTLVVKRKANVAGAVSAGLPTIAVRMPRGNIALALIRRANTPVAAPSANASGRPSPTRATDVWLDLSGKIDLILDGGGTTLGIESTVLDLTAQPPIILRPGWITQSEIEDIIGPVRRAATDEELMRSPGTRHRHYSPRARVVLVESAGAGELLSICNGFLEHGPVGFIGHTNLGIRDESFKQLLLENDAGAYAGSIYSAFRDLDATGVTTIVVEGIQAGAAADAVMDRLRRAASETIASG
jgi:L-threonylcarbamoyladenylate synthase